MLKKIKSGTRKWLLNHKKNSRANSSLKKITMCKKCYTFYYRSSWHSDKPMTLETDHDEEIDVYFTKCTACLDLESIFYEAEPKLVL